jgi:hypothetical protein
MKVTNVLSTAILFLLPGIIVPAYAQGHEQEKQPEKQQQKARPAQQPQHAERQQQAKPAQQPQRAQQAKPAQQPQRAQQAKPAQQPQRAERQQPAKPAQQPQRAQQARPAQQQQRTQADRTQPAAGHGRIPDDRFRASFGRGHTFHVNRAEFVGGSRRFQYGGYWFAMTNPWPVGWLYTDSVYVDYMNGGYFLCDPVHPGVYLAIDIG